RPGVSDAEIYATVARLLALRAGVDEVLARLSALLGEDQVPQRKAHEDGAPGRAARRGRARTRPPGRSAAGGARARARERGGPGRGTVEVKAGPCRSKPVPGDTGMCDRSSSAG